MPCGLDAAYLGRLERDLVAPGLMPVDVARAPASASGTFALSWMLGAPVTTVIGLPAP